MVQGEFSHRDRVHALFVQHSAELRGFILSILPNMSRADDVLQETFLTVSSKADDFATGTNFVAWACSIARYKALEDCKWISSRTRMLAPEVLDTVCAAQPLSNFELQEAQLNALSHCLSILSPHARKAIELRYARAHKASEIAKQLGWSTDSVYVVLSRARSALLKCIRSQLEADG